MGNLLNSPYNTQLAIPLPTAIAPPNIDTSTIAPIKDDALARKLKLKEAMGNFKEGVNSAVNSKAMLGGIKALGNISDMIPTADKVVNENDLATADIRNSANKALMSGALGPWGMVAGAANMIIDKTGGFTDASKGLGKGTDTLNSIASLAIPGAGWFAKKTDKFSVDDILSNSTGYTGTTDDATTAAGNANAKLLFGRNKANKMIADMKQKQDLTTGILELNKMLTQALSQNAMDISANNLFVDSGGWNQGAVQFGKVGMKVFDVNLIKRVAKSSKKSITKPDSKEPNEVSKLAKGGTLERQGETEISDQSVIPGGALHAHKHHLKDVDKDLAKQVTHKGVPVVEFMGDGGEVEQHAEIERGEIIFRKEITKKLEELWKDGSDEAMIEAGKLIADEIVNNTIDKSEEYEIED